MALICDRCDGRQEVTTTIVQLAQPGYLLSTVVASAPQTDLCAGCRKALAESIKSFVHDRPQAPAE